MLMILTSLVVTEIIVNLIDKIVVAFWKRNRCYQRVMSSNGSLKITWKKFKNFIRFRTQGLCPIKMIIPLQVAPKHCILLHVLILVQCRISANLSIQEYS